MAAADRLAPAAEPQAVRPKAALGRSPLGQAARYLPWIGVGASGFGMVVARLITNNYVKARRSEILLAGTTTGHIPVWVSKLYLASFIGLVVCGIWSFSIAWWAPALALVANLLTGLVPSAIVEANKEAGRGPYKRCASCGTVRPADYFALDEAQPDGHIPNCVACDQPEAWAAVQEMKNAFSDRRTE